MKAHLCTILVLLCLNVLAASGERVTIFVDVPTAVYQTGDGFVAAISSRTNRRIIGISQKSDSTSPGYSRFRALFESEDFHEDSVLCFPVWAQAPFGIFQQPVGKIERDLVVKIPPTVYLGRWGLSEELLRESGIDEETARLVVLKVVTEPGGGTGYDPHFLFYTRFKRQAEGKALVAEVLLPFLREGTYEVGIVSGRESKQLVRKRIQLAEGTGLRILAADDKLPALIGQVQAAPITFFGSADVCGKSVVSLVIDPCD